MADVPSGTVTLLFTDIEGSTRLWEANATAMRAALARHDALVRHCIADHAGHVFKTAGDAFCAAFRTASEALAAALEAQRALSREPWPEGAKLRVRMALHSGAVELRDGDYFGAPLNRVARLLAAGHGGQTLLSEATHDLCRDHLPPLVTVKGLGAHGLKDLERAEAVFQLCHPDLPQSFPPLRSESAPAGKETPSIAVLPFANMSGDPEQEYFSDGITEDIITDLSKVSALWVAARNTVFMLKGKPVDAQEVARRLRVTHLLEGSVRKAGGRVRITAQLIDGGTGGHVWAERYDRDLNDIFALQDEISQAIVRALKLKLLPEEKKAIEQRGTANAEAYRLYLMARQYSVSGNLGSVRRSEAIIRLCRRATEIDPRYARPWALMAVAQMNLRFHMGTGGDDGLEAAERALALDANLAEAHAAKARVLTQNFRFDEARREVEIALRLDPESYEANSAAGRLSYYIRRFADAIPYYEKAAALMESDYLAAGILISCYKAVGDGEGVRRAAERALARAEKIVAVEPDNGSATGFAVLALAALGEAERAKEWAERALLLDPDNLNLRYNLACTLVVELREFDAALDLLEPAFGKLRLEAVNSAKTDPDLDPIREHPRFKAMVAAAEARLARG